MLTDEYLARHDGRAVHAAEAFARDLMRGDPAVFKAGYTAPNAYLATIEIFELDDDDAAELRDRLQVDRCDTCGGPDPITDAHGDHCRACRDADPGDQ